MPRFFQFTQGTESRVRAPDTAPQLGRFRAVPPTDRPRSSSQLGLLSRSRGSIYGAVASVAAAADDDETAWQRLVVDLWVAPRQTAVKRVLDKWWSRYGVLVFLPALLVCCPCRVLLLLGVAWLTWFVGGCVVFGALSAVCLPRREWPR